MREDVTKAAATSTGAPEAAASDAPKPEIGAPEVGKSDIEERPEIALSAPEPATMAARVDKEAEAEPEPSAQRSAAE